MSHQLKTIPALDTTPSGRALPYIPEPAREHPENAAAPGACPVFRDCTMADPGHYDHSGHDLKVLDHTDGSTVLDAGMVALSGEDQAAIVYIHNAEFEDAAAVHAKTAELRRFLDQVDAMADRVFADHKAASA
ncbi:hypothetical protein ACFZCP_35250 [Streptomyces sp. NPDC007971]|uniref:hypothetical protein n=1 Tax=Streptomyces sp. NPDC007971 TaxID=3364799 RepID=UPI0036E6B74D